MFNWFSTIFSLGAPVWSYSCRGYRCKQGNVIDHEWISVQRVIGRVFQIGRTRIFCFVLFIYIVNHGSGMIFVERRTKKRLGFQIGIKPSTHLMSYWEL